MNKLINIIFSSKIPNRVQPKFKSSSNGYKLICFIVLFCSHFTVYAAEPIPAKIAREIFDKVTKELSDSEIKSLINEAFPDGSVGQRADLHRIALEKFHRMPVTEMRQTYTNNGYGVELKVETPLKSVLKDEIIAGDTILDIGCAYGTTTLLALEAGAFVTAVDISPFHLGYLLNSTRVELLDHLKIQLASFPSETLYEDRSFTKVVIGQVIHFLPPKSVEAGFRSMFRWLKAEGKLYLMMHTVGRVTDDLAKQEILNKSLDQAKREAASRPNSRKLYFPTYAPDLNLTLTTKYLQHPQDEDLTSLNLQRVGFLIDRLETFFLPHIHEPYEYPKELHDTAFIRARKSLDVDLDLILEEALDKLF